MSATIIANKVIFGNLENLNLKPVGFPEGKIRLRIRPDDYVVAFVKTEFGIKKFYIKDNENGTFSPLCEIASNQTIQ